MASFVRVKKNESPNKIMTTVTIVTIVLLVILGVLLRPLSLPDHEKGEQTIMGRIESCKFKRGSTRRLSNIRITVRDQHGLLKELVGLDLSKDELVEFKLLCKSHSDVALLFYAKRNLGRGIYYILTDIRVLGS